MSHTKRIGGAYTISASGGMTIDNELTVTGNLTVTGTTNSVETTNTRITDRVVTYNQGESGSGVTGQYAGIEIDRGSLDDALLVFNETTDTFQISTDGGSSYVNILTGSGGSGISDVVDDTTPQLGGDLDVNGKAIISATSNEDIQLQPSGTGRVAVDGAIKLNDISTPSSQTGATILYAKAAAGGGTGLHFVDGSTSDELVSKSKAIVYGLIF
jgi:hypothetical protein